MKKAYVPKKKQPEKKESNTLTDLLKSYLGFKTGLATGALGGIGVGTLLAGGALTIGGIGALIIAAMKAKRFEKEHEDEPKDTLGYQRDFAELALMGPWATSQKDVLGRLQRHQQAQRRRLGGQEPEQPKEPSPELDKRGFGLWDWNKRQLEKEKEAGLWKPDSYDLKKQAILIEATNDLKLIAGQTIEQKARRIIFKADSIILDAPKVQFSTTPQYPKGKEEKVTEAKVTAMGAGQTPFGYTPELLQPEPMGPEQTFLRGAERTVGPMPTAATGTERRGFFGRFFDRVLGRGSRAGIPRPVSAPGTREGGGRRGGYPFTGGGGRAGGDAAPTDYQFSKIQELTGLDRATIDAIRGQLQEKESGFSYTMNNQGGGRTANFGAYQMNEEDLARAAKYIGDSRPPTREEFLRNPAIQEKYLEGYWLSRLEQNGISKDPEFAKLREAAKNGDIAARKRMAFILISNQTSTGRDALYGRGWSGDRYHGSDYWVSGFDERLARTRLGTVAQGGTGTVKELQAQAAGIRKQPISPTLRSQLSYAAGQMGLEAHVTSGGQSPWHTRESYGKTWTGSHRHDLGGAGDIKLWDPQQRRYLNMSNPADQARMQQFVAHAVSVGAQGVGAGMGYMGGETIHVGGGTAVSWGGAGWIEAARQQGMAMRAQVAVRGETQATPTAQAGITGYRPTTTATGPVPEEWKRGKPREGYRSMTGEAWDPKYGLGVGPVMEKPEALIVHHTGPGVTTATRLAAGLKGQTKTGPWGLSVHFAVDPEGKLLEMVGDKVRATFHAGELERSPELAKRVLSNINTYGVEVMAPNEKSVKPVQRQTVAQLYSNLRAQIGPEYQIWGHGELTPTRKEKDEGATARMIREGRIQIPPPNATLLPQAPIQTATQQQAPTTLHPDHKLVVVDESGKPVKGHAIIVDKDNKVVDYTPLTTPDVIPTKPSPDTIPPTATPTAGQEQPKTWRIPTPTARGKLSPAEISSALDQLADKRKKEKLTWKTSIVDLMKLANLDSSRANREKLAKEYGYTGPNKSYTRNVWLHKKLQEKMATGEIKIPGTTVPLPKPPEPEYPALPSWSGAAGIPGLPGGPSGPAIHHEPGLPFTPAPGAPGAPKPRGGWPFTKEEPHPPTILSGRPWGETAGIPGKEGGPSGAPPPKAGEILPGESTPIRPPKERPYIIPGESTPSPRPPMETAGVPGLPGGPSGIAVRPAKPPVIPVAPIPETTRGGWPFIKEEEKVGPPLDLTPPFPTPIKPLPETTPESEIVTGTPTTPKTGLDVIDRLLEQGKIAGGATKPTTKPLPMGPVTTPIPQRKDLIGPEAPSMEKMKFFPKLGWIPTTEKGMTVPASYRPGQPPIVTIGKAFQGFRSGGIVGAAEALGWQQPSWMKPISDVARNRQLVDLLGWANPLPNPEFYGANVARIMSEMQAQGSIAAGSEAERFKIGRLPEEDTTSRFSLDKVWQATKEAYKNLQTKYREFDRNYPLFAPMTTVTSLMTGRGILGLPGLFGGGSTISPTLLYGNKEEQAKQLKDWIAEQKKLGIPLPLPEDQIWKLNRLTPPEQIPELKKPAPFAERFGDWDQFKKEPTPSPPIDTQSREKDIEIDNERQRANREKERADREKNRADTAESRANDAEKKSKDKEKASAPSPKKSVDAKTHEEKVKKTAHNPETERPGPNDNGYGAKHNNGDMTGTTDAAFEE